MSFEGPLPGELVLARGEPSADLSRRLESAASYSAQNGGTAWLVIEGERVVAERYDNGGAVDRPQHLFSGTKSFCCAIAAAAVADGKLALDELVADTIVEWRPDPRKSRIRVRQLLDLSSGLAQAPLDLTVDGMRRPERQRVHDKYRRALELPAEHEPGTHFQYGGSHFAVFGEVIKRKLGQSPLDYLKRRVLDPIGMRVAGWHLDAAGNPQLGYGAWTTARHWARFGLLLRDGGRWHGEQVLPADVLGECVRPGSALPAYGLALWLNRPVPSGTDVSGIPVRAIRDAAERGALDPSGPPDTYAAAGHQDQRLYVIPSERMVVIRLGTGRGSFSDAELLGRLLHGAASL